MFSSSEFGFFISRCVSNHSKFVKLFYMQVLATKRRNLWGIFSKIFLLWPTNKK